MSCKHPLLRFYNPRDADASQRIISLGQAMAENPKIKGYEDVLTKSNCMLIPCGKCIGCRIRAKMDWATRMELEAKSTPWVWFITFTYDDKHVPTMNLATGELYEGGIGVWHKQEEKPEAVNVLNMDDMTRFWKRLRKKQDKIRYFYCGEYGENTARPHYHAIIYGLQMPDLEKVKGRNQYYSSKMLEETWGLGQVTIAYAEPGTYNYVAGYVTKKMHGNDKQEYAEIGLPAPYACMSRRPGIGMDWLETNIDKLYEQPHIQLAGKTAPIPRAFDKIMEERDPERLWRAKQRRQQSAIWATQQQMQQTDRSLLDQFEIKDRVLTKAYRKRTGVL